MTKHRVIFPPADYWTTERTETVNPQIINISEDYPTDTVVLDVTDIDLLFSVTEDGWVPRVAIGTDELGHYVFNLDRRTFQRLASLIYSFVSTPPQELDEYRRQMIQAQGGEQ